jgi:hypothetical protein
MWLWAGYCNMMLEHWWMRGREKTDMTWMKLRYRLTTTVISLIEKVAM